MAMTVQMRSESAVTERDQDAFGGSSIENGVTMIPFDLRQHDFQQELGTPARLYWRKESYHVAVHALSTFHNPLTYRVILAQGFYLDAQHQRRSCTPESQGVSTSQHMSHSVIRWACSLAVVCGVSLRHSALLFAALFWIPMTKSSLKRWLDAISAHLPPPRRGCSTGWRSPQPPRVTLTATTR
jgi:hypothetical protein